MAQAAFAAFQEAQKALVDALQLEYFCDDLEPPPTAFGWTADEYKVFYESGGAKQPLPRPPSGKDRDFNIKVNNSRQEKQKLIE